MNPPFDIVDVHQHVGPYFNFHIAHCDPAGMVAEMDRLGIRQGWIAAHTAIEGDAPRGNDEAAEAVRAFPGRFLAYVVVDPNYTQDVGPELERCLAQPEYRMIKLHPSLAGYPLDGPDYEPVWQMARDRNCPVLTHAWAGDQLCGPPQVRCVMERHPEIHLIFGHALFPPAFEEAAALAHEFPNLWLDVTTSNQCYGMIEHAVETIGADRIVFGSDMPFISAAGGIGRMMHARIPNEDKAKILGGNARRMLAAAR